MKFWLKEEKWKYELRLQFTKEKVNFEKEKLPIFEAVCKTNLSPIWLFQTQIWIWKAFSYIWLFNLLPTCFVSQYISTIVATNIIGQILKTSLHTTRKTNIQIEKQGKLLHVWMNGGKSTNVGQRQILVVAWMAALINGHCGMDSCKRQHISLAKLKTHKFYLWQHWKLRILLNWIWNINYIEQESVNKHRNLKLIWRNCQRYRDNIWGSH